MKKKLFAFVYVITIFSSLLDANIHPRGLTIRGDFLYWQPLFNNSFFAQTFNSIGTKRVVRNIASKTNYKPAFRVAASYDWDCLSQIQARFTYFNGGASNTLNDVIAFASLSNTRGTLRSRVNFKYYGGDLAIQHQFYQQPTFDLNFIAGLHYTWSRFLEDDRFRGFSGPSLVVEEFKTKSQFWGVGPEIGFNFDWTLPLPYLRHFALIGDARAALLVNNTRSSNVDAGRFERFELTNSPIWQVGPALDTKLGLRTGWTFCSFALNCEIGYEFVWYHNAINKRTTSTNRVETITNLAFQGPYAALEFTF